MVKHIRRGLVGLLALAFWFVPAEARAADAAVRQVLAPSGALKVGVYRGSPTSIIEGQKPEDAKGVGYDLGKRLAAALGVPFAPTVFPANGSLLKAVAAGEVDVVFTNATPARAKTMDFSQTFMSGEKSFLVPAGSPLKNLADATRPGTRIGVSKGSSTAKELAELYPAVTLEPIDTLHAAGEMLTAGRIDAFATNNAILYELSDEVPGSHVLPGHWGMEHFAAGIPKGREAGMPFLRDFIAKATAGGSVAEAIRRVNLRGVAAEK